MEEDSNDREWSICQQKEGFNMQKVEHTLLCVNTLVRKGFATDNDDKSDIIQKGIALEETNPASSVLDTLIKVELIPSELNPTSLQQEHSVIKEELIVAEPKHEGLMNEMYNSQCYNQELPTQASPELSTTSTIPNSLDSSLSNMSVVIEEELILEGTDEEHIIVKCFVSNTSSEVHQEIHNSNQNHSFKQKEPLALTQPERITGQRNNGGNKHLAIDSCLAKQKLTHNRNNQFKCNITSEHSNTTMEYGIRNYKCDVCDKMFNSSSNLSVHKRIHSKIKKYECDVCHKTFSQSSNLTQHKQTHSGIKKYECDVCHKKFTHPSNLSQHKQCHSEIKKHECAVCHKMFSHASSLSQHKHMHNGNKKYECDVCHKFFTQSSNLLQHKLSHSGIKMYECDVCHKGFTLSTNLLQHKLIHSGIKKYECDVCHKSFTQSGNLSQHKRTHSGIKKSECDVCHKTFTHSSTLSQHKQIHSAVKKYECDVCHKTLTHSSNLKRHKQIHSRT